MLANKIKDVEPNPISDSSLSSSRDNDDDKVVPVAA
jgi:hypothetical protein